MINQNIDNPFRKLKVRSLILRGLLIIVSLSLALGFVLRINNLTFNLTFDAQILTLISYILFFGLLCLWQLADFKRLGINLKYVVGKLPNNHKWLLTIGLVILMLMFSISAYLVSFYLLSLLAPNFVEDVVRQIAAHPSPKSSQPILAIVVEAIAYVVVAPITEEFIFRGIILQRWAAKWGIRSALVVSSLVFGIGHANVLGLSVFGLVMGVLYIKTRTLIVPMTCHALNNLLVVIIGLLPSESKATSSVNALAQLRSDWWIGVILMTISLFFLVRFLSRNWPRRDAAVPYLLNAVKKEI